MNAGISFRVAAFISSGTVSSRSRQTDVAPEASAGANELSRPPVMSSFELMTLLSTDGLDHLKRDQLSSHIPANQSLSMTSQPWRARCLGGSAASRVQDWPGECHCRKRFGTGLFAEVRERRDRRNLGPRTEKLLAK